MIVLDTSVLVYAVGAEHALRRPAQQVVEAVAEGRCRATTTVEVVQEFAHARARRHGRRDAVSLARSYATLLAPLLVTEPADLDEGLRLFLRYEPLGSFDAVLAAVSSRLEPEALVSADRAFAAVQQVRFLSLDSPELERLL